MSRPATRQDADGGFTLIELLVVVMITGVLLTILSKAFLQSFTYTAQAQDRSEATVRTQNALESLSREVRTGDPIVSGNGTSIQLKLYQNNVCYQRTWAMVEVPPGSGKWTLQRTTLTNNTATCPSSGVPTTETMLTNLKPGQTIFTYYDASRNGASATSATSVDIELSRNTTGAQPIDVKTTVQLRNTT